MLKFVGLDPTMMLITDFAATKLSPISLHTITSSETDTMTSVVQSDVNIVVIGVYYYGTNLELQEKIF